MSPDDSTADYSHSVTRFIDRVKHEDADAAGQIWQRYFDRLLPLAKAKIKALPNRSLDEEDILVSVFDRFFRAASENRFERLQDRGDLWQILLMLTNRSIADQYRRAATKKRGGADITVAPGQEPVFQVENLIDDAPDPGFVTAFNESLARAVMRLGEESTREVALLRMEGFQNREIAEKVEISLSSVERKLRVIREVWEQEFSDYDA